MRIVDVRETTVPIASPIKNAFIGFSKMTCSRTAVITDAVRDSNIVIGYDFHSNGRYAQSGLMQERFIPLMEYWRILQLVSEEGWEPSRYISHGGHPLALNSAAGLGLGGNRRASKRIPQRRTLCRSDGYRYLQPEETT